MKFEAGQSVYVPCKAESGAFPDEALVTIDTGTECIQGFVKRGYITTRPTGAYLPGQIVDVTHDTVKVRVPGSFFTTASGLTSVSSDWADAHIEKAA